MRVKLNWEQRRTSQDGAVLLEEKRWQEENIFFVEAPNSQGTAYYNKGGYIKA